MTLRRFKLIRYRALPDAGGHTLFFAADGGGRRHPAPFFQPHEVPDFEGDTAWFEGEGSRARGYRIVRRVHENGQPYEERKEQP
jgi:hypothetical protein